VVRSARVLGLTVLVLGVPALLAAGALALVSRQRIDRRLALAGVVVVGLGIVAAENAFEVGDRAWVAFRRRGELVLLPMYQDDPDEWNFERVWTRSMGGAP